ncbi:MAG: hypothetical protein ABI910_07650 [Gemmatimonadota bacterium]
MRIRRLMVSVAVPLSVLVAASACRRANDAQQATADGSVLPPGHVPVTSAGATDLQPVTQALLDSGNAAFRQKDYPAALGFYARASEVQPEHAAPWFGTYMVGQATRNSALTDSALRMVRARAPELREHPSGSPLPPGGANAPGAPPSPYSPHQPLPVAPRTPAVGRPS